MTRKIIIQPQAERDIDEYYYYIAQTDRAQAMQFFDAARQTFAQLARMPGLGRVYITGEADLLDIHRWFVKGFKNHLIFYRFDAVAIEIIRVIDGRRDLQAILQDLLS
jgi:toxin ParE1/3/4